MTFNNLKIVLTNALCCSSEQAIKVSNMLSRGDKCAKSELIKLKVLLDRINLLSEYLCDSKELLIETFDTEEDALEWTVEDSPIWIWVNKEIIIPLGELGPNGTGGYISFEGEGVEGNLRKDCLVVGQRYRIEWDMYVSFNIEENLYTTIQVSLGDTIINYNSEVNEVFFHASVEGICTGDGNLNFMVTDLNNIVPHGFDNIQVFIIGNDCLTEEQIDSMIHKVMETCEICDCQLN